MEHMVRKVMHKLKSQWLVIGVLGAATMGLGATGIPLVSADEVSGQAVTENAGYVQSLSERDINNEEMHHLCLNKEKFRMNEVHMDNQNLYFKLFI